MYGHIKRVHFGPDINFEFLIFWKRIFSALKWFQTYEDWPFLSEVMIILRCSNVLSCFVLFSTSNTIIYVFYWPTNASFWCDCTHIVVVRKLKKRINMLNKKNCSIILMWFTQMKMKKAVPSFNTQLIGNFWIDYQHYISVNRLRSIFRYQLTFIIITKK